MGELQMNHSKVLDELLDSDKRIIVLEGGARSTKTWSIFQWIIIQCLQYTGRKYLIIRLKMTWVRLTLLEDFNDLWQMYDLPITPVYNPNRAEQIYFLNGNQITFIGLDEPQKVHGKTQDVAWINEAMEISQKSFTQINVRTKKKILLDYNPSAETHWIYDDVITDSDCEMFHSTMRDNPFLEKEIVAELDKLERTDPIAYKIYNLGLRAQQKGLIFKNFEIVPDMRDAKILAYGLDFGYVNDPTALVAVGALNGELWLDEMIYETGLVNVPIKDKHGKIEKNISDKLEAVGMYGNDEIIADSAERKSIAEIYASGWNIHGARKVAITYGLDILLRYKINITARSINLIKEFRNYKWAVDKEGEPVKPPKPIDAFNHGIDAVRYVGIKKLSKRKSGVRRVN